MMVDGPDGTAYRVRRRWLPWAWRRRVSPRPWDVWNFLDFDFADGIGTFVASVLGLLFLAFLAPVVLLVLLTGVEFFLLILLLPIAIVARFVLGKHWTVEVRQGRRLVYDVDGGGWAASGTVLNDLAEQIRLGGPPTTVTKRVHVTSTQG